jgi:hypothetical protein
VEPAFAAARDAIAAKTAAGRIAAEITRCSIEALLDEGTVAARMRRRRQHRRIIGWPRVC